MVDRAIRVSTAVAVLAPVAASHRAGPGLGAVRLPADRGGTWPSAWASPGMRLYALAGVRSVVAMTGTIPERRMAGLGPRARVCGWPANDVRAARLIRWVPLVFADEQAAVA
jgi:hypothetical protein